MFFKELYYRFKVVNNSFFKSIYAKIILTILLIILTISYCRLIYMFGQNNSYTNGPKNAYLTSIFGGISIISLWLIFFAFKAFD